MKNIKIFKYTLNKNIINFYKFNICLYSDNISSKYSKFNSINISNKKSFMKKDNYTNENNLYNENDSVKINSHFDYTKHSLLNHLYMFKYNSDNIGYIIHDKTTNTLIGIDFGEFEISNKVVNNLEKKLNSKLNYLFTTHSHWDHAGGNKNWKEFKKDSLTIIVGDCGDKNKGDYIEYADKRFKDLETISIGDISIACMFTPGHLKSHVVYVVTHVDNSNNNINNNKTMTKIPLLFCGDTLFHGSVGKVFNGTYEELYESIQKIMYLHPDTLVFPGHEYTVNNLEFNLKLDPNNEFAKDKLEWAKNTIKDGNFTVGSRLIEEKLYNSFLRSGEEYFLNLTKEKKPFNSFVKLRHIKDELSKNNYI